jgi:23S rRNA (uracil1939-C5)-methyltransferase
MILEEQLRPLRREQTFELKAFLASDEEFHYRNRVQVHIEGNQVGFLRRASHEIVDVDRCLIVEEDINLQLKELRREPPKPRQRIELRSAEARDKEFFSQVNRRQNIKLQNILLDLVDRLGPLEFWDLYGGAGNFSLPIAEKYPQMKITCVESSAEAVAHGRDRAKAKNLTRIDWVTKPVEEFLKQAPRAKRLILLDPPRAGLSAKALGNLLPHLAASKLIYLSCNPSSFVRDALELTKKSGLKLQWVQGLDMFPQTDHIEVLSLFN